jgi:hypothetical protein
VEQIAISLRRRAHARTEFFLPFSIEFFHSLILQRFFLPFSIEFFHSLILVPRELAGFLWESK